MANIIGFKYLKKMEHRWSIVNTAAFIAMVIVNFLAVSLPFFGRTVGDVSDLHPTMLTPADYAFSIWSVIYLGLGVFAYRQSRGIVNNAVSAKAEMQAIGPLFLVTSLLNIAWLLLWQSLHIGWAFLVIFTYWILLMVIYYRLSSLSNPDKWIVIPFRIYLAWICIATLANMNVFLIANGFNFFGLTENEWTAMLIIIGVLGTWLVQYLSADLWFTAIIAWAYTGIFCKNAEAGSSADIVPLVAGVSVIVLLISGISVKFMRRRRTLSHT